MANFEVESALGMDTGLALVVLTVDSREYILPASAAEQLGKMLYDAASISNQDRMLFQVITEEGGKTVEEAGTIIQALRDRRLKENA